MHTLQRGQAARAHRRRHRQVQPHHRAPRAAHACGAEGLPVAARRDDVGRRRAAVALDIRFQRLPACCHSPRVLGNGIALAGIVFPTFQGRFCSLRCAGVVNNPAQDAVARFWSKVEKTPTCWLWHGFKTQQGYGFFSLTSKRHVIAHRFAYEMTYGLFLPSLFVCHTCDTPGCVNPAHLFLGSPADNTRDASRKGRMASGTRHGSSTHPERSPRGSHHGNAKLSEEDVRLIRLMTNALSLSEIARAFGVDKTNISKIVRRQSWQHLP